MRGESWFLYIAKKRLVQRERVIYNISYTHSNCRPSEELVVRAKQIMPSTKFSSAGFDLDALSNNDNTNDKDVVLELGTDGTQRVVVSQDDKDDTKKDNNDDDKLAAAQDAKERGNQAFSSGNYETALEWYTAAIEATPGHPTGEELWQESEAWQQEQYAQARQRLNEKSTQRPPAAENGDNNDSNEPEPEQPKFQPKQQHPHAPQLAIYHCNRAAAALSSLPPPSSAAATASLTEEQEEAPPQELQDALHDCDIAILLNPTYIKAYTRRATVHERLGQIDQALADAKAAVQLDTTTTTTNNNHTKLRATVQRLQKLEDERVERLKVETMDKLKDLGNSILGNFGLSLDNFQAQQDPNTGSYSISFNQQNKKSE